jgi:hypothetical protein
MRLIIKYYDGNEYEGGENIIPFEYKSLEDAEYDFLTLLEETKKNYHEFRVWQEANNPMGKHKYTQEKWIEYMDKFREKYDTNIHSGWFTFMGDTYYCDMDMGNIDFYTLDDWFERYKTI